MPAPSTCACRYLRGLRFARPRPPSKSNTKFNRRYSYPLDRINTAVICDRTCVLTTHLSSKDFPTTLRRVVVKDDKGKRLAFLTNNFTLTLELIADLYRQR